MTSYKKIAEIIKNKLKEVDSSKAETPEEKTYMDGVTKNIWDIRNDLANHFEKEYENTTHCDVEKCNLRLVRGINCPEHGLRNIPFNKKQFLELCEVD